MSSGAESQRLSAHQAAEPLKLWKLQSAGFRPAPLDSLDWGGFMRRLVMNLSACNRRVQVRSRREFLVRSSFGFGSLALGYLMNCESATASVGSFSPPGSLAPRAPHFPAKARSVIFIFLQGGPSQVDTFDPKPELSRL